MKLLIVESPAKARTISKYLNNKFTVKASVGHVRDLPKSNKKAIEIEKGFKPHYEILPDKEDVITEIKELAQKSNEIYLATDPDREGEAIAWHLKEAANLKGAKRVVFHEITENAVSEAINHPRGIDKNLRVAQEARRVLDRLFGYDLSALIWQKVRYGLSAGRVQSPALRIIMEREREIRAFKPEKFWIITADVENKDKENFTVICSEEPKEKSKVDKIIQAGKKEKWIVSEVKETKTKRKPKPPFITSTLQQTASNRLGFSPAKTMSISQRLYEAGLITYMRTDSTTISQYAANKIEKIIKKNYGEKYYSPRKYKTKSKSAQEAHEAIRPTNVTKETAGKNSDQTRLYKLIWERTIASQMTDTELLRTKIVVNVGNDKNIPFFFINGSRILFDGWMKADKAARKEDVQLPKVEKNEELKFKKIDTEEKETQPPKRYTEAGLVKELEKRGIGRPSTYASIIKTIQDRGYVEKINSSLHPTDTGDVVSTFLENNFKKYISDDFTSKMEDTLDEIAEGEKEYEKTLKEFYKPFTQDIETKKKTSKKITNLGKADSKFKCPDCKGEMIIKLGKSGKFLSCKKFPKCTGARTIEGKIMEGPKETGEKCPECESPLVEREGKFGKFISCSTYPKCKYIKEDPKEAEKRKTGIKCPQCNEGEMMEKMGRFGTFYACSNYPKCRYAIKAKPTGKKCKMCGSLMMEGTKTIPERCSDKKCPNHRPDKL